MGLVDGTVGGQRKEMEDTRAREWKVGLLVGSCLEARHPSGATVWRRQITELGALSGKQTRLPAGVHMHPITRHPDSRRPSRPFLFCRPSQDRSSRNDRGRGGANDGCFLLFRDFGSGPAVRWSEKASLTAASGRKEGRPPTDGVSECMVGRLTAVISDTSADLFILS